MFLYHLTVQGASHISHTVHGSFTGRDAEDIVCIRGTSELELISLDPKTGTLHTLDRTNLFSNVRSISRHRLSGEHSDYLLVANDSGRIIILAWDPQTLQWITKIDHPFGRSGVRRCIAGEYVASDPAGRAVMWAAVERQKLVVCTSRHKADLLIGSPLVADDEEGAVCFGIVALHVGYENPRWAAIEATPSDEGGEGPPDTEGGANKKRKQCIFYELDVGLNHVVKNDAVCIDGETNLLIAVPGEDSRGVSGPGGVLVCSPGLIEWIPPNRNSEQRDTGPSAKKRASVKIPHRLSCTATRPTIVTKALSHQHYNIIHTENGDLFKVEVHAAPHIDGGANENSQDGRLRLVYIDTVPVASGLCLLPSGFLFVASEGVGEANASHSLYQIVSDLGSLSDPASPADRFAPHHLLHLLLVHQLPNTSPLVAASLSPSGAEPSSAPSLVALNGSSVSLLQYALNPSIIADSPLPSHPQGLWTLKEGFNDRDHSMIILSFTNEGTTIVLSVGESVEEMDDHHFESSKGTLAVAQLVNDDYIQVFEDGYRQVFKERPDAEDRAYDWSINGDAGDGGDALKILDCCINSRQMMLYCGSAGEGEGAAVGYILYFELDAVTGRLEQRYRQECKSHITSLVFTPTPPSALRSPWAAIASTDNLIRIVHLDPKDLFNVLSVQALASPANCLACPRLDCLDVALANGVYVRLAVDGGVLSDAQMRFMGQGGLSLASLHVEDGNGAAGGDGVDGKLMIMAPDGEGGVWMRYDHYSRAHLSPLNIAPVSKAVPLHSPLAPNAIAAIDAQSGNLLIFSIEDYDHLWSARERVGLSYCPRRVVVDDDGAGLVAVIESDHRAVWVEERAAIEESWALQQPPVHDGAQIRGETVFTHRGPRGKWAGSVAVFNRESLESIHKIPFTQNSTATSACWVTFHDNVECRYLAISHSHDYNLLTRQSSRNTIVLYDPKTWIASHETVVDGVVGVMEAFAGRLLVGVGGVLRLYDAGLKKILRKCEIRVPSFATAIKHQGWRVFVGDAKEGLLLYQYHKDDNRFQLLADETTVRSIQSLALLDYDTVAGCDKLGSFFVSRLPASVSGAIETHSTQFHKKEQLFGAPHKFERIAAFHIGCVPSFLVRCSMSPATSAKQVLLYGGIDGRMGVFVPMATESQVLAMQSLEDVLRRKERPAVSVAGRSHLKFRSCFCPVKQVIDGDLCEMFIGMSHEDQEKVKIDLENDDDAGVKAIIRQIQEMRINCGI